MPIDEKRFERLKPWFEYMEEWDRLHAKPDKRVAISITIPLRLKKRLEKEKNMSRFVEKAIEKALSSN